MSSRYKKYLILLVLCLNLIAILEYANCGDHDFWAPKVDQKIVKKQLTEIRLVMKNKKVKQNYSKLLKYLRKSKSSEVQYAAAIALSSEPSPKIKNVLLKMLKNENVTWTRRTAVWDSIFGHYKLIKENTVLGLLDTEDQTQLIGAIRLAALMSISDKTRNKVLDLLNSKLNNIKTAVISFIGIELGLRSRYKTDKVINKEQKKKYSKLLLTIAKSQEKLSVRKQAVSCLLKIDKLAALPVLIGQLSEDLKDLQKRKKSLSRLSSTIMRLQEASGQSFSFSQAKDDLERESIVRKWLNWWNEEQANQSETND